jgi:hypothetical protein
MSATATATAPGPDPGAGNAIMKDTQSDLKMRVANTPTLPLQAGRNMPFFSSTVVALTAFFGSKFFVAPIESAQTHSADYARAAAKSKELKRAVGPLQGANARAVFEKFDSAAKNVGIRGSVQRFGVIGALFVPAFERAIQTAPQVAVVFALREKMRSLNFNNDSIGSLPASGQNVLGGAVAGFGSHALLFPFQHATYGSLSLHKPPLRLMYRGMLGGAVGAAIFRGIQFGMYDTLKPHSFSPSQWDPQLFAGKAVTAYASALCGQIAAHPYLCVHQHASIAARATPAAPRMNFVAAASELIKGGGARALFVGLGSASTLACIPAAAMLVAYDYVSDWYFRMS